VVAFLYAFFIERISTMFNKITSFVNRHRNYVCGLIILGGASFAHAGSAPITITPPFDYSEVATEVATAAGVVLALTFGWMIGFRLVKTVIGRLAGQA